MLANLKKSPKQPTSDKKQNGDKSKKKNSKQDSKGGKHVVVDQDKLQAAVSVLAQSAGQDPETIQTSLIAEIAPDSDESNQE